MRGSSGQRSSAPVDSFRLPVRARCGAHREYFSPQLGFQFNFSASDPWIVLGGFGARRFAMATDGTGSDAANAFDAARVAAEAVREAVEAVVQSGGDLLYDHYLEERNLAFSVARVMQDMAHVVDAAFLARSEAVGGPSGAAWAAEEEPVPCAIDTWARGAVALKTKPKSRYEEYQDEADVLRRSEGGPASVGSRRSRLTSRSKKSRGDTAASKPQLIERPSSPPPGASGGRPVSPSVAVRAQALAEMRAKEAEAQKRAKEAEAAARLEKERHDKIAREIKGKDFTYDIDGTVMPVTNVNTSKLPPQFTEVGVAIDTVEDTSKRKHKDDSAKARARRKESEMTFFLESGVAQPPLTETIELAPGVVLREGEAVLEGPDLKSDPQHMSRKDFTMHQSMLETQQIGASLLGGGSMELGMTTMGSAPPSLLAAAAARGSHSTGALDGNRADAEGKAESKDAPATEATGGPAVDPGTIPDFDPTAGGVRVSTAPGAGGEPVRDVNLELTRAPTWGANVSERQEPFSPGSPPRRPDTRQREKVMGQRAKQPRERPFIAKPSQRKHLAPPLYPAKTRYEALARANASAPGGLGEMPSTLSAGGGSSRSRPGDSFLPPIVGSPSARSSGSGSVRHR